MQSRVLTPCVVYAAQGRRSRWEPRKMETWKGCGGILTVIRTMKSELHLRMKSSVSRGSLPQPKISSNCDTVTIPSGIRGRSCGCQHRRRLAQQHLCPFSLMHKADLSTAAREARRTGSVAAAASGICEQPVSFSGMGKIALKNWQFLPKKFYPTCPKKEVAVEAAALWKLTRS